MLFCKTKNSAISTIIGFYYQILSILTKIKLFYEYTYHEKKKELLNSFVYRRKFEKKIYCKKFILSY